MPTPDLKIGAKPIFSPISCPTKSLTGLDSYLRQSK